MKQWLKEQVMMAALVLFHWPRLAQTIHRWHWSGRTPARPFANEPDWIVGMLMRAYEGNTNHIGQTAYALALAEWTHRQAERKIATGTAAARYTAATTEEAI